MGRLLEALKRLEPEMQAVPLADPIAPVKTPSDAATGTCQTAVLEPVREEHLHEGPSNDDFCDSQPLQMDFKPVKAADEPITQPFSMITAELNSLNQLLDEDLPHFENSSPDAAIVPEEIATSAASATSIESLEHKIDDQPEADEDPFGFFEHSSNDSETFEFIKEPEQENLLGHSIEDPEVEKHTIVLGKKPAPHKDRGVFGTMARNLLAQLPHGEAAAVLFTSPTGGEGKTESILPLAEALIEESGRRTILVDANLHHPDLTHEWLFDSRKGIFEVLTGEADWWDAVQETGIQKLSILINNGLPEKNSIVTQPLAFSELLENLKREYPLVLIDAASLAHDESIPMVRHCQGVCLVVRLGHSSRQMVHESQQIIDQAGGKLLGFIAVGNV